MSEAHSQDLKVQEKTEAETSVKRKHQEEYGIDKKEHVSEQEAQEDEECNSGRTTTGDEKDEEATTDSSKTSDKTRQLVEDGSRITVSVSPSQPLAKVGRLPPPASAAELDADGGLAATATATATAAAAAAATATATVNVSTGKPFVFQPSNAYLKATSRDAEIFGWSNWTNKHLVKCPCCE